VSSLWEADARNLHVLMYNSADSGSQEEGLVCCSLLPEVVQRVLVKHRRFAKGGPSTDSLTFFSTPTWTHDWWLTHVQPCDMTFLRLMSRRKAGGIRDAWHLSPRAADLLSTSNFVPILLES